MPDGVYQQFQNGVGARGNEERTKWAALFADYSKKFPELAARLAKMQRRALPDGWDKNLPNFPPDPKGMANRESSGKVLNPLAQNIPWLAGDSADLAKSNKTNLVFQCPGNFFTNQSKTRTHHSAFPTH